MQTSPSLDTIEAWLKADIAPQAEVIDQNSQALFQAFHQLGDRNLLALRLSSKEGGHHWTLKQDSQFQILLSSYSGALAFLATQHQSATRMIAASSNTRFIKAYLPSLISGEVGCGVGFSHLRRAGAPMVSAREVSNGYQLSGTVPWVTGYQCFAGFICGAILHDGQILMGWVPLSSEIEPKIEISSPQSLASMGITQTVAVKLNEYLLTTDQVLAIHPADWLQEKDRVNTLHHGFYALGAARGALRLMHHHQPYWQDDAVIREAIATFEEQYRDLEHRMLELLPRRHDFPQECLHTKAQVNQLASKVAQAAVALVGGGANALTHPAQRIYREVLAFTVFGQTLDAKRATLSALSASVSWRAENHPFPALGVEV